MSWGSLDEFIRMGGYGQYVWGSFAVVALAVAAELLGLARRRRAARAGLRARPRKGNA